MHNTSNRSKQRAKTVEKAKLAHLRGLLRNQFLIDHELPYAGAHRLLRLLRKPMRGVILNTQANTVMTIAIMEESCSP